LVFSDATSGVGPHNDIDRVIESGLCIGCGACEYIAPETYQVTWDSSKKRYSSSVIATDKVTTKSDVCPFSNYSESESTVANRFLDVQHLNDYIGYYETLLGGRVVGDHLLDRSSGGISTYLQSYLIENGIVDEVISVVYGKEGVRFKYSILRSNKEIQSSAKSAYYPVSMKDVLDYIKNNDKKFVITAVPCFAKAIRAISENDKDIKNRIEYIFGVVCGHMKSGHFADALALQAGYSASEYREIDFRAKSVSIAAKEKPIVLTLEDKSKTEAIATRDMFAGNWGHNLFKLKACDYCDDTFCEVADISFGDMWLEKFQKDNLGASLVISRNKKLSDIIENGILNGQLDMCAVSEDEVIASQIGGIRHKTEGLAYRLGQEFPSTSDWMPQKRLSQSNFRISSHRRRIYEARLNLRLATDDVKGELDSDSIKNMKLDIDRWLAVATSRSIKERLFNKFKKIAKKLQGT
jgi:coenzyme F420-reducing hydrogenase beta subunit